MTTLTLELQSGKNHNVIIVGTLTAPKVKDALDTAIKCSGLALQGGFCTASDIYQNGVAVISGKHKAYLN